MVEDVTNTPEAQHGLEETSSSQALEPDEVSQLQARVETLEGVLDDLLQRDRNRDAEDQVLGEMMMEHGMLSHRVLGITPL